MAPSCSASLLRKAEFVSRLLTHIALVVLMLADWKSAEGVALDAVSFQLPTPSPLTGALASNNALLDAERIHTGLVGVPHSYASYGDNMYAVTDRGQVVNVAPCRPVVVANLRSRGCQTPKQCGHLISIRLSPDNLLLVLDAYRGLFEVHPYSGVVRQVYDAATLVNGRPSLYLNDFTFLQDGTLVFSDSSPTFDYDNEFWIRFEGRPDGRLLTFNASSGQAKEFLAGISYPTGLEVTGDGKALLVSEAGRARILRIDLSKDKFMQRSFFSENLPGMPEHIRKSGRGTYWVGLSYPRYQGDVSITDQYANKAESRNFLASRRSKQQLQLMYTKRGLAIELDNNGKIVRSFHDPTGLKIGEVLELMEYSAVLYVGTRAQSSTVRIVGSPNSLTVDSLVQVLRGRCKVAEDRIQETKASLEQQMKAKNNPGTSDQGLAGMPGGVGGPGDYRPPPLPRVDIHQGLSQLHRTLIGAPRREGPTYPRPPPGYENAQGPAPPYRQDGPNFAPPYDQQGPNVAPPYQSPNMPPPPYQGPNMPPPPYQGPNMPPPYQNPNMPPPYRGPNRDPPYQHHGQNWPPLQQQPGHPSQQQGNSPLHQMNVALDDPFLPANGPQAGIPLQRANKVPLGQSLQDNGGSGNQPHVVHSLHQGELVSHVILGKKAEAALAGNLLTESPQVGPSQNSNPTSPPTVPASTVSPRPQIPVVVVPQQKPPEEISINALGGFLGLVESNARAGAGIGSESQQPKQSQYAPLSTPDQNAPGHLEPLHGIIPSSAHQADQTPQSGPSFPGLELFTGSQDSKQNPAPAERQYSAGLSSSFRQSSSSSSDAQKQPRPDVVVMPNVIQSMQMFHPTDRPEQSPPTQNQAGPKLGSNFQQKTSLLKQGLQQLHKLFTESAPTVRSPTTAQKESKPDVQAATFLEPVQARRPTGQRINSGDGVAARPISNKEARVPNSEATAQQDFPVIHRPNGGINENDAHLTKQPLTPFSGASAIHPSQRTNNIFDKRLPANVPTRIGATNDGVGANTNGSFQTNHSQIAENINSGNYNNDNQSPRDVHSGSQTSFGQPLSMSGPVSYDSRQNTKQSAQESHPPNSSAASNSAANAQVQHLPPGVAPTGYIQVYQGPGQYLLIPLSQTSLIQALRGLSATQVKSAQIVASNGDPSQIVASNGGPSQIVASNGSPSQIVAANGGPSQIVASNGGPSQITSTDNEHPTSLSKSKEGVVSNWTQGNNHTEIEIQKQRMLLNQPTNESLPGNSPTKSQNSHILEQGSRTFNSHQQNQQQMHLERQQQQRLERYEQTQQQLSRQPEATLQRQPSEHSRQQAAGRRPSIRQEQDGRLAHSTNEQILVSTLSERTVTTPTSKWFTYNSDQENGRSTQQFNQSTGQINRTAQQSNLTQQFSQPTQQLAQSINQFSQPAQQFDQKAAKFVQSNQHLPQSSHQFTHPTQQPTQPARQFTQPTQELTQPVRQFTQPTQQLAQHTQELIHHTQQVTQHVNQFTQPTQQLTQPTHQFTQSKQLTQPTHQFTQSKQQLTQPTHQFTQPTQQFTQPSHQFTQPPQQRNHPAHHFTQSAHQFTQQMNRMSTQYATLNASQQSFQHLNTQTAPTAIQQPVQEYNKYPTQHLNTPTAIQQPVQEYNKHPTQHLNTQPAPTVIRQSVQEYNKYPTQHTSNYSVSLITRFPTHRIQHISQPNTQFTQQTGWPRTDDNIQGTTQQTPTQTMNTTSIKEPIQHTTVWEAPRIVQQPHRDSIQVFSHQNELPLSHQNQPTFSHQNQPTFSHQNQPTFSNLNQQPNSQHVAEQSPQHPTQQSGQSVQEAVQMFARKDEQGSTQYSTQQATQGVNLPPVRQISGNSRQDLAQQPPVHISSQSFTQQPRFSQSTSPFTEQPIRGFSHIPVQQLYQPNISQQSTSNLAQKSSEQPVQQPPQPNSDVSQQLSQQPLQQSSQYVKSLTHDSQQKADINSQQLSNDMSSHTSEQSPQQISQHPNRQSTQQNFQQPVHRSSQQLSGYSTPHNSDQPTETSPQQLTSNSTSQVSRSSIPQTSQHVTNQPSSYDSQQPVQPSASKQLNQHLTHHTPVPPAYQPRQLPTLNIATSHSQPTEDMQTTFTQPSTQQSLQYSNHPSSQQFPQPSLKQFNDQSPQQLTQQSILQPTQQTVERQQPTGHNNEKSTQGRAPPLQLLQQYNNGSTPYVAQQFNDQSTRFATQPETQHTSQQPMQRTENLHTSQHFTYQPTQLSTQHSSQHSAVVSEDRSTQFTQQRTQHTSHQPMQPPQNLNTDTAQHFTHQPTQLSSQQSSLHRVMASGDRSTQFTQQLTQNSSQQPIQAPQNLNTDTTQHFTNQPSQSTAQQSSFQHVMGSEDRSAQFTQDTSQQVIPQATHDSRQTTMAKQNLNTDAAQHFTYPPTHSSPQLSSQHHVMWSADRSAPVNKQISQQTSLHSAQDSGHAPVAKQNSNPDTTQYLTRAPQPVFRSTTPKGEEIAERPSELTLL